MLDRRPGAHAGGPDERARRDPRPVRERDRVLLGLIEGGRDADIDAAFDEEPRGVVAEAARKLGEDLRGRVHKHPVLPRVLEGRVVADCVPNEVHQLGERFDARIAGPDEDERQLPSYVGRVEHGSGCFESAEDVVPQTDCVREVVEAETVVGKTGYREHAWDRPDGDDEVLVAEDVCPHVRLDRDRSWFLVERGGAAEEKLGVRTHHPQRDDAVPRLERARRCLGQHRREEHEVVEADDRRAAVAEIARDVGAAEAASEDQCPSACLPYGMRPYHRSRWPSRFR